jgi:uncharacterized membrane protein YvlD (DUF360 family)
MNIKHLVIAALASGIAMWILAGLWHKLLAVAFYARETHANHEGIGIIFLAYLILALLMAYLFPINSMATQPVMTGLTFGIVIGLLWVFPHELAMAGAHGKSLVYVFKNAAWHVVEQGIGGINLRGAL